MSQLWLFSTIILGLLTLGLATVHIRKVKNNGLKRDILLLGFAPALVVIAVLEFMVVPTWGVEVASSLAPIFYVCIILPASILANQVRKYQKAQ